MTKLLFTDIDGTLMNSQMTISTTTKHYFRQLLDQDFKIYVASGRKYASAREVAAMIDPRVGVIASNGAVTDLADTLDIERLSHETIKAIYRIVAPHKIPMFFFDLQTTFYTSQLPFYFTPEDLARITSGEDNTFQAATSETALLTLSDHIINGIVVEEHDLPLLAQVKEELAAISALTLSSSHAHNIELIPAGTSKATAIAKVQAFYGVKDEDIFAFGDGENDLEMLAAVHNSVAMGNAPQQVKDAAAFTTLSNDEDGIKVFMENYLAKSF